MTEVADLVVATSGRLAAVGTGSGLGLALLSTNSTSSRLDSSSASPTAALLLLICFACLSGSTIEKLAVPQLRNLPMRAHVRRACDRLLTHQKCNCLPCFVQTTPKVMESAEL